MCDTHPFCVGTIEYDTCCRLHNLHYSIYTALTAEYRGIAEHACEPCEKTCKNVNLMSQYQTKLIIPLSE